MFLGKHRYLALALGVIVSLCSSTASLAAENTASPDAIWIDVRSPREYQAGHIEGAINIPHGDIGHKIFQFVPDPFTEVHLYDGSLGTFAGLALEILMESGYQSVINEGSYDAVRKRLAEVDAE